jgi:hypothetical protein
LSFAWYIHNQFPPETQEEERDGNMEVDKPVASLKPLVKTEVL